jgi:molecular chaperone HscA
MLLQISEPGQSTNPHEHRLAVGIDLGTTHSLVATVRSGEAVVIADEQGRALLPSVVLYSADQNQPPVVGWNAIAQPSAIRSIKRLMGSSGSDTQRIASQPNTVIANQEPLQVHTSAGGKTPVEVSADILRVLHERAVESLGDDLVGAVITVPAYFDDAQRQATKDAAKLAGLPVLRLINEPTAAALAYGLDAKPEGFFLVYDLGGGTFDVSILQLRQGVFEVLATRGDTHLGGDDFDHAIALWVCEQTQTKWDSLPADQRTQLRQLAKQTKEQLTDQPETNIVYKGQKLDLSREAFATITQTLVNRTLHSLTQALKDANLSAAQMADVVLVGGSTRMPTVRQAVASFFGKTPLTHLNPDEVVALGAAIQANVLAGNRRAQDDFLLLDITPLSLGVETMGGLVDVIIPRNSTLPIARAQDFTTYQDGQTQMSIHVVQGENELVSQCRSLARFSLRGIPPMVAGAARIRVRFEVDADGLLSVFATEQTTGVEASVVVKPSHGLDDDTLKNLLEARFSGDEAEQQRIKTIREQAVEAVRLLNALNTAVSEDRALLIDSEHGGSEREYQAVLDSVLSLWQLLNSSEMAAIFDQQLPDWIEQSLTHTRDIWLLSDNKTNQEKSTEADLSDQLDQATQHLLAQSEGFAARRMNQSIAKVLTGQSIDRV